VDAGGLQGGYFFRIVRDEADGRDLEVLQDFGGELEVAIVGLIAELLVGFDRVEALVLEFVGAELGHEADAAAFLVFVEQDAGAFGGDAAEGEVELVVAVAAEGVEGVSGKALGVDADDGGVCRISVCRSLDVAHDEGYGRFEGLAGRVSGDRDALEAEDAEVSPAGGEVGFGNLGDTGERHTSL